MATSVVSGLADVSVRTVMDGFVRGGNPPNIGGPAPPDHTDQNWPFNWPHPLTSLRTIASSGEAFLVRGGSRWPFERGRTESQPFSPIQSLPSLGLPRSHPSWATCSQRKVTPNAIGKASSGSQRAQFAPSSASRVRFAVALVSRVTGLFVVVFSSLASSLSFSSNIALYSPASLRLRPSVSFQRSLLRSPTIAAKFWKSQ